MPFPASDPVPRFWSKVERKGENDCWNLASQARRYPSVWCYGKSIEAHRFSYELHYGPILPGLVVMHTCDNTHCVNPRHLKLGSHADNQFDKVRKQRQARGERQGHSKLNAGQIIEIRRQFDSGVLTRTIARQFSITQNYVYAVGLRRCWKHIA